MTIRSVSSPEVPAPNGHFSQAVVAGPGEMVFISGMTSRDHDGSVLGVGDVGRQAEVVYGKIARLVEVAGGTLADVCRLDVYVRNIEDFAAVHAARTRFFPGTPPASTMVEISKFAHKDFLIEVNAIAMIPAR